MQLHVLMSIVGGGDRGGGGIDRRVDVDASASLVLRVDSCYVRKPPFMMNVQRALHCLLFLPLEFENNNVAEMG